MRARKAAVALREPTPDDAGEPFPPDDSGSDEPQVFEPALSFERVCLACGGGHEGCEHPERVSFLLPSPVIRSRIERLRRAAAEHRAAERALRALAVSEQARGRADVELPAPRLLDEPPPWEEAAPPAPIEASAAAAPPCPRCAEREHAPAGDASPMPVAAPRKARKKAQAVASDQATFSFLAEAEGPARLDA
jgi:hypothetical protein